MTVIHYLAAAAMLVARSTFFGLLIILTFSLSAQAQSTAQRTFVSTSGLDTNTASLCSAQNPCRSFTSALTVTTAGGEIIALTSGGYGAVTINKAVQITAPTGVYVAITKIGAGNGITIAAGSNDVIVLRGLTLNGLSGASNGIDWDTGAALHIENCVINGFDVGILFNAAGELFAKDTIVRNGGDGISISASSGTAQASIDRCRVENNRNGVVVSAGAEVSISDSVASGNGGAGGSFAPAGFKVENGGKVTLTRCIAANNDGNGFIANFAEMTIESCTATGNSNAGMYSNNGVTTIMRVSNSTATNNNTGFRRGQGQFESYGNNRVRGNNTDISGTITTVGAN